MCSKSRAARLILKESEIQFESINEPIWKRRIEFLKINPEGELPVIIKDKKIKIIGYFSLAYYLNDKKVEADYNETIWQLSNRLGVEIPHLSNGVKIRSIRENFGGNGRGKRVGPP